MGPERVTWKGVEVPRECGLKKAVIRHRLTSEGERGCYGGQIPDFESWLNSHSDPRASGCQSGEGLDHAV